MMNVPDDPTTTDPPPLQPRRNTAELYEDPTIYRRRWFLLGVMCLCLVMIVMAVAGLNVAIPEMQTDLEASATDIHWIMDSYAIVFAGLLLSAGAIGDRFGRKLALQGGLGFFVVGAILGGLADSVTQVMAARVIMGIGAAFIMPATLSLITSVFPPQERGKAIAVWAGFAGAGGALGPLLVGALLTGIDFGFFQFGPYWFGSSFLANLAAIIPTFIAITVFAPQSKDDSARPLDPVGAVLSIVGISAVLYGIIEGPAEGWTSTPVLGGFAVGLAAGIAFVAWEFRQKYPMLPMTFFRDRRFNIGSAVITVSFLVMFGFFLLSSQYLQFVHGYSPLRAGAATLPLAFTMIIVAPRSASMAERFGYKNVVSTAMFIGAVGFGVMAVMDPHSPYVLFAVGLVILAIGQGMVAPPSTAAIMSSIPMNQAGVGSAVNDTTREFGGAFGIAILGTIVTTLYRDRVDVGGLPPDLAEGVGESVGAAHSIGEQMGGPEGDALIEEAGEAFTGAFNVASVVAAGILVVTGFIVRAYGHRQTYIAAEPETVAPELDAGVAVAGD